jgi:hypothetical protein
MGCRPNIKQTFPNLNIPIQNSNQNGVWFGNDLSPVNNKNTFKQYQNDKRWETIEKNKC